METNPVEKQVATATVKTGKPVKKKKRGGNKKERWAEFACTLPAIFLLIVTIYYPLADLVRVSFTNWNLLSTKFKYVGLKNWKWFFTSSAGNDFVKDMGTTIEYAVWHVILTLVIGLALALLMNRLNRPFSTMRAIIFLPKYVGMSSAGILFLWILNTNYGVVNNVLAIFGISPIGWTTTEGWAMISVMMLTIWHSIGYAMMIYLSAMTGIPAQYKEAAMIDGAGKTKVFRYITLPLLAPTTMYLVVTHFISSMKVFNAIDIMTQGGPYGSTEVVVYLIYKLAFKDNRIDRSAVVALVFFVFLLIVTIATMGWRDRKTQYDI